MTLQPKAALRGLKAYKVPRLGGPIDLYLDGNEGLVPSGDFASALGAMTGDVLRRYPSTAPLEARFAAQLGVEAQRVVVTSGGDDALDRACRAMLTEGDELILPSPSFEMIWRYANLLGARVLRPAWPEGPWPRQAVLDAINERTRCIAVVTPNNPTGAVATVEDIAAVAQAAPQALILADLAYVEFADEDPTAPCLAYPNVVVFRTMSKAWGLAGLRVGYAAGPAEVIGWLRAAGNPYPVSAPSMAIAAAWLREGQEAAQAFVQTVRLQRASLTRLLDEGGQRPLPSQANFVFCRAPDALGLWRALGARGIAIRAWPGNPELGDSVRITVPGRDAEFARLVGALEEIL